MTAMIRLSRAPRACALLLLWLLLPGLLLAERTVAVGDVHGDLRAFTAILREAGILDSHNRWAGGSATLVQTGDFLDRGPASRAVMDLLRDLEKQARRAGGRVVVLLGNHEVMNIVGDLRYVSAEEWAAFADAKSAKRRRDAYKQYQRWQKQRAAALQQPEPQFTEEMEAAWIAAHPVGFVEHRQAFSAGGRYGRWLRGLPAIAQAGEAVFVHGGLHPEMKAFSLDGLRKRVAEELRAYDQMHSNLVTQEIILPFFTLEEQMAAAQAELERRKAAGETGDALALLEAFVAQPNWLILHPSGPLWFRGFADWAEEEGAAHSAALLQAYGARHFVVGHTPQRDGRVQARFDGRVFLIDTGMLASYYPGGRASALELRNGHVTAIYPEQRVVLLPSAKGDGAAPAAGSASPGGGAEPQAEAAATAAPVWLGPQGQPLPFRSDEEVLEFLRTAKVVSQKRTGQGINNPRKVLLEKDGVRAHAVFRDVDESKTMVQLRSGPELMFRDSFLFEPAAYELGRMLGMDNIPPAVRRRLFGQDGSLQLWVEGAITENMRLKEKRRPPDNMRWSYQLFSMRLFDELIYNTDRNQGNILIDPAWKVWLIDHTRAFRRFYDLKGAERISRCERGWYERLRDLDEATARERLRPYLNGAELDGLFRRREKLLQRLEQLIRERGEEQVLFTAAAEPAAATQDAAAPQR